MGCQQCVWFTGFCTLRYDFTTLIFPVSWKLGLNNFFDFRYFPLPSLEVIRNISWDWKDGSVIESKYCSPKGLKFVSLHPHEETYNCFLTPPGGPGTFDLCQSTGTDTNTDVHAHKYTQLKMK